MYDIRQFKPALFALLLLGMSGFALAAQWPGLWVLATGGVLLNAWLVKTGRFTPMPRFLASIVTLIAFLYIFDLVMNSQTTAILIIGQFLVLLQLVKLYEHRANRDYAQLIILSLLLMVAAAINTASFIFGLMFIAYLFLSLYVCLLFHLKVESEEARKAVTLPNVEPNPNTLRQDQRFLSSSMRRLTGLISGVAVAAAIVVFLFFPRGTGANLLGPQLPMSRPMTGFSEHVGFQEVAKITQSNDAVADVKVYRDGKLFQGTAPIYLRGLTLNRYTGPGSPQFAMREGRGRPPYQWLRSLPGGVEAHDGEDFPGPAAAASGPVWKQVINLQPLGSNVLFAMAGPVRLSSQHKMGFTYSVYDDYLQAKEYSGPADYEVVSTGKMPYVEVRPGDTSPPERIRRSVIEPEIGQYARLPDVSGRGAGNVPLVQLRDEYLKAHGFDIGEHDLELAQRRGAFERFDRFDPPVFAPLTPYDELIARNIEKHLRTTFTYTLDLTDAKRIEGQDPMVAFLYDLKRGHCEYFAGAMTLMLQSLYMPARVVIGFRCDDYNTLAEFYHVSQNQAHAWVEARGGWDDAGGDDQAGEWLTYDPTSGREDITQRSATIMTRVRNAFEFLEHTWATSVIAYDRGSRDNLVQTIDTRLTKAAESSALQVHNFPNFLRMENWEISIGLLNVLITLAILALVGSIGWFVFERWKMWRRAARIGIESLPTTQRLHLARQLGFYDDLLTLLERRGIFRPMHFTPMEFTDSLSFLPADVYHSIRRLTEVFYRIRYGRQELSAGQRTKLEGIIAGVEQNLGPPPSGANTKS